MERNLAGLSGALKVRTEVKPPVLLAKGYLYVLSESVDAGAAQNWPYNANGPRTTGVEYGLIASLIAIAIVGVLMLAGKTASARHEAVPITDKLEMSVLPPDMVHKVDQCHGRGMAAGRLIENDAVIGIRCYEE